MACMLLSKGDICYLLQQGIKKKTFTDARCIHLLMISSGLDSIPFLCDHLIRLFAACGCLIEANKVFYKILVPNVFTWNAIISAHIESREYLRGFQLYQEMQTNGVQPDHILYLTVLKACGAIHNIDQGRQIHDQIIIHGLETDVYLGSSIIDMYMKCMCLEDAHRVFDKLTNLNIVAWNALISVYAQQGHAEQSLQTFEEMISKKVRPDNITFVNLLSSCSHGGLLEEGLKFFHAMSTDYNVKPSIEHYGCVVDLYGRAGQLAEAEDFIAKYSLEKQPLVWTNLLGACRLYDDVERGKRVAENILHLEAQDSATYVLLASMC